LRTKKPVTFDAFDEITATGRFVLQGRQQILGGGIILKKFEHFSAI
jgi:sulfate adenylyltransferase subunit 1 (EFTu-like GTPase family)